MAVAAFKNTPGRLQRLVNRWTESLSTRLTPEELDAKRQRAIELYRQIQLKKEELKAHQKQVREILKKIEKELDATALSALRGAEDRDVEIHELYDTQDDEVIRIRQDNGEMIGRRRATDAERQESLDFGSAA